jgi:lipopolysaccharide export system protein LptA
MFTYFAQQDRLVAVGKPVRIDKENVKAVCGTVEFFPKQNRAILTGDPVVSQTGANGNTFTMSGERIKLETDAKGNQVVLLEPGTGRRPSIKSGAEAAPAVRRNRGDSDVRPARADLTPASKQRKKAPAKPGATNAVPIRESSDLSKIPDLDTSEEP